jgi:hypothetical protein
MNTESNQGYPAEFVRRRKGQRYERPQFDMVFGNEFSESVSNIRVIGQFNGFDPYGAPQVYDSILLDSQGRTWACYRIHDPSRNFAICHNMQFRSIPAVQS